MNAMISISPIELAVKATIILVAGLSTYVGLRRASAASRHLVLALSMVALVAVPLLSTGLPGWDLAILPATPEPAAEPAPMARSAWPGPSFTLGEGSGAHDAAVPGAVGRPVAPPPARPSSIVPEMSLAAWLIAIWLGVAAFLLTKVAAGLLRVRWIVRRGEPIGDPAALRLLDQCSDRVGIRTRPRLIGSERVDVPMVRGWLRPTLVLPRQCDSWSTERMRVVLLHELGHLARGDWPILLLGRVVTSLYWFHPLAWILERQARRECERACDDLVVSCGTKPSDYAEHLLSIARGLVATPPAPVLTVVRRPWIEGRLRSILNPLAERSAPSRRVVVLASTAFLALLLPYASLHLSSSPALADDEPREKNSQLHERHLEKKKKAEKRVAREGHDDEGERWFKRGYSLHDDGKYDEAIDAFNRAAELGHRPATSLYNIACGYSLKGDVGEALDYLGRAQAEGFDDPRHLVGDSDLDPLRSDSRFQTFVDRAFEKAGIERRADKHYPYRNTLERFARMKEEGATNGKVWSKVGVELLMFRELGSAIEALHGAVEHLGEHNPKAMYNLACAYSLNGQSREALRWLDRAVAGGFDYHERFLNDTDLDGLRGSREFKRIMETSETLSLGGFPRRSWEKSEYSEARWAPAIERYEAYVEENPASGRAWFNLGYALHYSSRFNEAIAAFDQADSLGHRPSVTAYNLACSNAMLDRNDAAFGWLDKAVERGFGHRGHLERDEDLDGLRTDPRFEVLVQKLREKEQAACKQAHAACESEGKKTKSKKKSREKAKDRVKQALAEKASRQAV